MSDSQKESFKTGHSSGESKSPESKAIAGESKTKPDKARTAPPNKGSPHTPRTKTTAPEEIIRHNISDEELTMLLSTNRDGLAEFMWVCVGAAIGLFVPVLEKGKAAWFDTPSTPLTIISTIEICIFSISIVLAGFIAKISSLKSKKAEELVTEIRGRKKR